MNAKATVAETAVLREAPSKDADRASCMTWAKMCETGPCGEKRTTVAESGQIVYISARTEEQFEVGAWNNYWYKISLDNWDCRTETWVYGEFLTIDK